MKKNKSAGGKIAKLDRYEWDYSECPDDEAFECYLYEYARTSKEFCLHFETVRKSGHCEGSVDFGNGFHLSFNCPEFPTIPWLKIPQSFKKSRVYQPFIFAAPALAPAAPIQPLQFNPDTGEEVVKFEICWMATKSQIMKEFERWVDTMIEQRAIMPSIRMNQRGVEPKATQRQFYRPSYLVKSYQVKISFDLVTVFFETVRRSGRDIKDQ